MQTGSEPGGGDEAAAFLARVEARLAQVLAGPAPATLRQAASQLCLAGGAKRARPLLLSRFASLVDAPAAGVLDAAVAIELVHSASLLHDDVVDEGELRRGQPTARMRYGNDVAVLAGDFVLATALELLGRGGGALVGRTVEVVASMTRAALVEIEGRRGLEVTQAKWRLVAEGKTGALFGLCGYAAGTLAGNPQAAAVLEQVGARLGLAFQLADDLVDFAPGEGKDPFADLKVGNPNLVVVLAAQRSPRAGRLICELRQGAPAGEELVRATAQAVLETGAAQEVAGLVVAECAAAVEALAPYRGRLATGEIEGWARRLADGAGRFA